MENGADVISCSWWCEPNDLIAEAIDNAVYKGREGKGCVFVKSAGNYTLHTLPMIYPILETTVKMYWQYPI